MIRAALFDYGDTLVVPRARDRKVTSGAVQACYSALARAGLGMPFEEFADVDESLHRQYARMEAEEDRDIPDTVKYRELVGTLFPDRSEVWRRRAASRAKNAFWSVIVENYVPEDGLRRTLSRLKSMGLKMAVLSNHHNHQALVGHLRQLDLDQYFARVFSSDHLGVRKPNPEAFRRCLAALGVEGGEAIFVGDSMVKDVGGARACGMRTVLVLREPWEKDDPLARAKVPAADFEVQGVSEVPRIVRLLNGGKTT